MAWLNRPAAISIASSAKSAAAYATICQRWLQSYSLPGLAVALIEPEGLSYQAGFGKAQLELNVAVTADSVFELASVTKLFTAEAVMLLVSDGSLRLDHCLGDYLPALPEAWQAITLEQILRHSSGIRNYTSQPEYWLHTREDLPASHILELVAGLPLDFAPGSRYAYDNTGFYLLGLVLEAVSGQSYADVVATRIFKPLGMSQTRCQDYTSLIPGRVAGYSRTPETGQSPATICNKPYYSPTGTFSAGCLVSTPGDLARWLSSLHVPSQQALRQALWSPRLSTVANELDEGFSLGLGWFRLANHGQPFWGHNGGIRGFCSALVHFPERQRSAVVLCNADWLAEPHKLALELLQV